MNTHFNHIIVCFQNGSGGSLLSALIAQLMIPPEERFFKILEDNIDYDHKIRISDVGDVHSNNKVKYVHAYTKEDVDKNIKNGLPQVFGTHCNLAEYIESNVPNSKVIYIHHSVEDYYLLHYNHFWKASLYGSPYTLQCWFDDLNRFSKIYPEEFENIINKFPWEINKNEYHSVMKAKMSLDIFPENDFTRTISLNTILQIEFTDIISGNLNILSKLQDFLSLVPDSYSEFILKRYALAQKPEEQLLKLLKD